MVLVQAFVLLAFFVAFLWLVWWWKSPVPAGTPVVPSTLDLLEQEHTRYRAGALAKELNLELLRGDPNLNLFIPKPQQSGVPSEIFMRGAPHGLALQFRYFHLVTSVRDGRWVHTSTEFACDLCVVPRTPFPPFEVSSRTVPVGTIKPRTLLPEQRTGDSWIDSNFMVRTTDERLARVLAVELSKFQLFELTGVHLVGDGDTIRYLLHRDTSPVLASALCFSEALALYLSELGQAVEQRDA